MISKLLPTQIEFAKQYKNNITQGTVPSQSLAGEATVLEQCPCSSSSHSPSLSSWGSNIKIDVFAQRVKTKNPAGILTQDSLNTSQTLLLATAAALEEPNFRKLGPIC